MTKSLLLRCNNEAIHIDGNPKLLDYLVNWISMHNYQKQRYLEDNIDIFVFDNPHYLVACKIKAIKLGLLKEATQKKS